MLIILIIWILWIVWSISLLRFLLGLWIIWGIWVICVIWEVVNIFWVMDCKASFVPPSVVCKGQVEQDLWFVFRAFGLCWLVWWIGWFGFIYIYIYIYINYWLCWFIGLDYVWLVQNIIGVRSWFLFDVMIWTKFSMNWDTSAIKNQLTFLYK